MKVDANVIMDVMSGRAQRCRLYVVQNISEWACDGPRCWCSTINVLVGKRRSNARDFRLGAIIRQSMVHTIGVGRVAVGAGLALYVRGQRSLG